ncbi:MAG: hypothetical protein HY976_03290, partial [Candidatus Kerfeldbacteria bacterium]|nr:hypothetical protein [Candidatus Kerfeldbacteria bacterium]
MLKTLAAKAVRFFPKFFGFSRVPRPTFTFVRFIAFDRTARPVFMGFLLALLVMTLLPVGAGETERQVFNPQSCQGWDQAALATRVEVPSRGSVTDFSTGNSATFSAPPGLTPEALNQAGSALGCSGWNIPLSGFAPNVDRAALTVSLGAAARPHSEDVVVVRTSIDGRNWTTRSSFVIDNQYSNERNGGYTLIPLDDITALDTLRRLQVEVVPALAEGSATRLFVDHIGLAADVTTTAHAKTKRLDPATCVGWSNADQAKRINYRQNTLAKDFSDRNVALIQRFADANPTVGNTDQSALTCETFGVLKATKGRTVIGASIVVSLAARSGAPGTDAVIIEYSLDDGATWQAGTTTVVTGEDSNASRGGYLIAPITGGLDRANLAPLKVRVRYVAGEEPADAEVRVDGIGLDVSTVPEPDRAAGGLSFLARSSFLPLEEPVIVLEEGSLLGYEVTDSSGRSVDIQADTKTSSRGVEVIVRRGRQIRPGTYTVKLKAKQGRRIVEETQSFTWGVASINTPKSSYALGEAMPIVLGVVDVNGRTVCDADLQLDVESPRGDRRSFSTKSGTVSASATCGPKSITDAPDYLVRIVAEEAGLYRMKLTVQTADGPQSADLNVQVTAVRPFTIERIAPSRINPKQNYRVRLIVQPDRDHRSDLIERVPSGMVVSEISNDGRLEQRDGEQVINWPLDLKANREVELSYVIDAPDVAPALFTLGPAALEIVGEPRQWQIASDEIVERRGREFAYESIPPAVHDWDAIQDNLLETTKPIYGPGETVAIQSWSDGFADDENPKRPTSLRDLTVRGPDGSIVDPPRATETLNNLGRRRDNVYLGPPDDFRPGVYTVSAVTAEGNDVSSSFEWGTLGISIDQPQPKVRSLLRFDITTLNDFGANKCDDALRLTIDRPDGERRVFDSRDGSLRVCPDGRSGAVVEFSPSLTGQYQIELRRIRDGVERFVQQSFSANDRAATPKNVRAEMEKAVKAEADTFRTGDRPRLRVRVDDSAVFGFLGVDGTSRRVTNIEVTDPTGRRVAQTAGRSTERQGRDTDELLDIDTSSFTTAGKYTARIDVEQGEYAETIEQDFTWGVLAVNLRRATERPETETEIGMAVLDDQGRTLCDTQLELTIRDPNGRRQTMRTDDGIDRNPKCRDKSVTNEFDYRALYRIGRAGTYELTLTARTVDGERTMTDSFEVRPDPAFDIERSVYSMRIYPLENYPVVIGVTPRADYRGPVVESLPESLRVIDLPVGVSETVSNGRRLLTWDVDWKAGERHELTYTLDYPDVSPAFYMAGPLQISDYREARPWQIASDSVTPSGTLGFSETAADDNMQWLTHTSPSTYTDQGGSVDTTTNANDLVHVVVKNAPTRNELLAGQIETNGTMHITRRDSSAVWTEELEVASVTATQTCDTTAGACNLGFNMAYEQLGGRAIVFYGKAANDGILYYNIWNGTSWAGEASTTFRASSTFDTRFVVAKPERGTRSNRILVMVSDAENDIYAMIFDGGTPGDLTTITGTSSNTLTKNFDGDWEGTTRNAVVFWGEAETAATNPYRYKVYNHGTDTWDGSATNPGNAHAAVNIGRWINVAAHLDSNRMAVLLMGSASDTRPAIWKNDDSSAGLIFGNEDALAETPLDNWGDVKWENYNGGTPVAMFVYSANAANADASAYQTWTSGTGFSAETDMPLAMGDDSAMWKLYSSPNNDEMMAVGIEFSDDLCFQRWSGTAWDSDCTTTEYSTTLPPDTATTHNEQDAFDFSYTPYSPWSRNWQFFADQTAADPTTTLANENVTPTAFDSAAGKFRLRFSVAELGGLAQIDARKKLQYTTGSPDDPAATWTDVDDPAGGGIWRYYDCDGGSSTCNDGTALTGTANLSGSPALGWWTQDKDAAAGTAMDQTAETVRELEYAVEANGATASTTYYFRMYDLDIQAPVLREQDNDGANDCATATCTYPSLTTAANTITLSGR